MSGHYIKKRTIGLMHAQNLDWEAQLVASSPRVNSTPLVISHSLLALLFALSTAPKGYMVFLIQFRSTSWSLRFFYIFVFHKAASSSNEQRKPGSNQSLENGLVHLLVSE